MGSFLEQRRMVRTMATQKQRIYDLEQQVRNLVQAVEELTQQVTNCMYCGKFIRPDEHRQYDSSTHYVMHDHCFISMLNGMLEDQDGERLAEKRNEETIYGYEIEGGVYGVSGDGSLYDIEPVTPFRPSEY